MKHLLFSFCHSSWPDNNLLCDIVSFSLLTNLRSIPNRSWNEIEIFRWFGSAWCWDRCCNNITIIIICIHRLNWLIFVWKFFFFVGATFFFFSFGAPKLDHTPHTACIADCWCYYFYFHCLYLTLASQLKVKPAFVEWD